MEHVGAIVLGAAFIGNLVYDVHWRPAWFSASLQTAMAYMCSPCEENILKPLNMLSIINRYSLMLSVLAIYFLVPASPVNSDREKNRSFPRAVFFGSMVYFYMMMLAVGLYTLMVCGSSNSD